MCEQQHFANDESRQMQNAFENYTWSGQVVMKITYGYSIRVLHSNLLSTYDNEFVQEFCLSL